jgi:G protein-coupled receptor 157
MVGAGNKACQSPGFVPFDTGSAPSYVAIVSCTFSCLGSVLIILTFFILKDMRTGSQKIITFLAIADLISAVGYIIGSANYLHHRNSTTDCGDFIKVCEGQATVTTYSSLVSFILTVILALYFFLIMVFKRVRVASNLIILYNIIAWGGPLVVVIPLLAFKRLGYSHYAASSWCYVKDVNKTLTKDAESIVVILMAGKFWEILSYIVVSVLYVVITVHIGKVMEWNGMEPRMKPLVLPVGWTPYDYFRALFCYHPLEAGQLSSLS